MTLVQLFFRGGWPNGQPRQFSAFYIPDAGKFGDVVIALPPEKTSSGRPTYELPVKIVGLHDGASPDPSVPCLDVVCPTATTVGGDWRNAPACEQPSPLAQLLEKYRDKNERAHA